MNGIIYTGSFVISSNTIVKAIAYKDGMTDSYIAFNEYKIKAAQPTFSVASGTYNNDLNVTITTSTLGASIYYTIDGSDPSPINGYLYNGPVLISKSLTLKAVAYKENMEISNISSAAYNLVVLNPTVSPTFGNISNPTLVSISCSTNGAIIKYTLDGSIPSINNGDFYTGPILIDKTTTLKIFAYKNGWTSSSLISGRYIMWSNQVIDSNQGTGQFSSIKRDSNGNIHVAYYDSINKKLKYATNRNGFWENFIVDNVSDTGMFANIAIDNDNYVHIVYYDNTNKDLKYANNKNGSFEINVLLSENDVGKYADIAIDLNNKIHIVCYDETNSKLIYLNNLNGNFLTYIVDQSNNIGRYCNIEIDNNNGVHIIYYDDNYGAIKYLYSSNGINWINSYIYYISDPITNISFKVDINGKLHISYYDSLNKDLIYLTNKTGTFISTTIINTNDIGLYSSIAVDNNGYVFISYYYLTSGDLYFSTNVTGTFVNNALQTTNNVGMFTSIDIDQLGRIYISYYDITLNRLLIQFNL